MNTMPSEIPSNVIAKDDALFFQESDLVAREEGDFVVYRLGTKTFRLNKSKARGRLAAKRVINGQRSVELNVLPLLDEVIFLRKGKIFFETRVTEYQMSGSVKNSSEEDLI